MGDFSKITKQVEWKHKRRFVFPTDEKTITKAPEPVSTLDLLQAEVEAQLARFFKTSPPKNPEVN